MSSQLDQARRLHNQGRTEDARAVLLRVLQKAPSDPTANQIMAVLLANAGKHDQAVYYADRAIAARPEVAAFHLLKGTILSNTPRVLEAIPIIEHATALEPGNARAWLALGALRQGARRHAQAESAFRRGLQIEPENPDLVAPLAGLLLETGRPEEAVDLLRGALGRNPQHVMSSEILAFCLNYDARATAAEVFEAHRRFGALVEEGASARRCTEWPMHVEAGGGAAGNAARRLRVGYVSADLRTHAVSTFFAPVLEKHDRERVEVFVYHTNPVVDDMTRRLRRSAEHWFGSRVMNDEELFERMRADRLDVLVELSGLTAQHRLAVMARKPARVQGTFIGYPNTTGLTAIDYLIVDEHTDPAGHEAFATERLARLPHCLLCYDPPGEAPEVGPPPCTLDAAAPFTFASFNTLGKTTDFTLRLWARVLGAVSGSRLMLKASGLTDPQVHEALVSRVARAGIDPARLALLGFTPKSEHLATYAMVDVCLDPHPFNGATTTADALYMGVPVVTLEGDRHVARAGMSILRTIGRGEWVARTEDEYVGIAAGLAGDRAALARIRGELRGQVVGSSLCDAVGYTRALEGMYAGWAVGPSAAR